jgi:predicted nucleic acid-binding protein
MIVVVDASVALKWFFQSRDNEADCDTALAILSAVDEDRIQLFQPPHFVAEVAAVLGREKPDEAQDDLLDLLNVECSIVEEPGIYVAAIDLSIRFQHHLFDTLYHAVALNTANATLVTADRRYYDKASSLGHITWLPEFQLKP